MLDYLSNQRYLSNVFYNALSPSTYLDHRLITFGLTRKQVRKSKSDGFWYTWESNLTKQR
jgi:hypothetical protein